MKALILASGTGKRLLPLTAKTHKCLIEIDGKPILERILDMLVKNKIYNIVITTGFFNRKVIAYVKKNYPKLKPEFVYNNKFDSTNYIYSMWLARKKLKNDDVLYLHSDLFFDSKLVKRLLKTNDSCVLVNKNISSNKDFNARIENNLVREIGVRIHGEYTRFCLPVYKLLKSDFEQWMKKIDEYINMGKNSCYAELALNELLNDLKFIPIYFDKEVGMEIDDFEDLSKAETL